MLNDPQKSKHWTNGGTGITNFSLKEMSFYYKVVTEFGDPTIFTSPIPIDEYSSNSIIMGSLHAIGCPKDLSPFWALYYKMKLEEEHNAKS